jgi:hypothetical protein
VIHSLGLRVVVVTFEAAPAAADYVRETGLPWVLLLDPTRSLYTAYGIGRGRWWKLFGPATLWVYARLVARGQRPRRASGDVGQLGGDVLIDPSGRIALLHVGEGPADRPAISALLAPVRSTRT